MDTEVYYSIVAQVPIKNINTGVILLKSSLSLRPNLPTGYSSRKKKISRENHQLLREMETRSGFE